MEEIDLKELLIFVKSKIGLFIVITALVCLLGSLYGLVLQTPMYSSYTTVILGSSNSDGTLSQSDVTLNKNLVDTYSQIAKSRKVLTEVIDDLDLDVDYSSLSEQITVSAVDDTEIIKITVSDKDPDLAKDIANVTAKYFTEQAKYYFNLDNVDVLDDAVVSSTPNNINVVKQVVIYLALGMVLGAGIIFVIFYFDRTIKTAEQVEQKIKLPILGSVEELNKNKRSKHK